MTHRTLTRARRMVELLGPRATQAVRARGILRYFKRKKLRFSDPPVIRADDVESDRVHELLDHAPVGTEIVTRVAPVRGYVRVPLTNCDQRDAANSSVRGKNPRKRNIYLGVARVSGAAIQPRWQAIHYKGAFKSYPGSEVYADYQSCIAVSCSGRSAVVVTGCVLVRRIIAPAGMKFSADSNGVFLSRLSDGMDYHPCPQDFAAKNFATICRQAMATSYRLRAAAKRADRAAALDKKEASRISIIRAAQMPSVRVTLIDSRSAGNCVEGSLAFAAHRLGVSRDDILACPWLVSVRGDRVLAAGGDRAALAVRSAWLRETTVTI